MSVHMGMYRIILDMGRIESGEGFLHVVSVPSEAATVHLQSP